MNNYDIEVKERFGNTDAYKEYEQKTANYSKDKWQQVNDGLNAVLTKFAECMKNGHTADSDDAGALVKELQTHITENYYTCTNEILAGLGRMYITDERKLIGFNHIHMCKYICPLGYQQLHRSKQRKGSGTLIPEPFWSR